jgi:hypothetical protein
MRLVLSRRGLVAVALFFSLWMQPLWAEADPVRFSLKTPVPQPDQPALIIVADQALTGLSVAIVGQRAGPGAGSGQWRER